MLTSSVSYSDPRKSENSLGLRLTMYRSKPLSTAIARTRCQDAESQEMHLKTYLKCTCTSQQAYSLGGIYPRDITQMLISGNST